MNSGPIVAIVRAEQAAAGYSYRNATVGFTVLARRVGTTEPAIPRTKPAPKRISERSATNLKTSPAFAPNAIRIPISLVRSATEYAITP